jgi:hypothetical protein
VNGSLDGTTGAADVEISNRQATFLPRSMTEATLQRTMRRGIALLSVPLNALVVGFESFVWSDSYGRSMPTVLGDVALFFVPSLLLIGSLLYLAVAGSRDLLAWLESTAETPSEG